MEPDLYDIGENAEEARVLHQVHNQLCEKLAVSSNLHWSISHRMCM